MKLPPPPSPQSCYVERHTARRGGGVSIEECIQGKQYSCKNKHHISQKRIPFPGSRNRLNFLKVFHQPTFHSCANSLFRWKIYLFQLYFLKSAFNKMFMCIFYIYWTNISYYWLKRKERKTLMKMLLSGNKYYSMRQKENYIVIRCYSIFFYDSIIFRFSIKLK